MKTRIAVIGGSGLYQLEGAELVERIDVPTPFGLPSELISIIKVGEQTVAFLPRHGKGHRIMPSEVPSKANIWALKSLGVEQILSVSAVGSLREEIKPGDFVLCDQLIDRTRKRDLSFFGEGLVGHVPFAEPFCASSIYLFQTRFGLCSVVTEHIRHTMKFFRFSSSPCFFLSPFPL